MSRDLTELNKVEEYLKANGIEYRRFDEDNAFKFDMFSALHQAIAGPGFDRHQIVVGKDMEPGACDWDIICHAGSYGCDQGLLEGMGTIFEDGLEGYLTAEVVIKRIEEAT